VAARRSPADLLRETFERANVEAREVQTTGTTIALLSSARALTEAKKQAEKPSV
jgi:hypothetical protein